jgi:hypothetical protein
VTTICGTSGSGPAKDECTEKINKRERKEYFR